MDEMMPYKGTVKELENEIASLEAHLANLRAELCKSKKEPVEHGVCRIEYNRDSARWKLCIRRRVTGIKKIGRFTSVYESCTRQEVVDAVGFLAADLIELMHAATQETNRKREE